MQQPHGFQMMLYTLIGASQVNDSVSISAGFGVIQCVIFFLFKTREIFHLSAKLHRLLPPDQL